MSTIKIRRDTTENWAASNPILGVGELGLDLDTQQFKIGNGTTAWNLLAVASGADGIQGVQGDKGPQGQPGAMPRVTWTPRDGNNGSALGTPSYIYSYSYTGVPTHMVQVDQSKATIHDGTPPLGSEGLLKLLYNPLSGKYVGVGLTKLVSITKTGNTLTYGTPYNTAFTGTNSDVAFDAMMVPGENIVVICRGEGALLKWHRYDITGDVFSQGYGIESQNFDNNITNISLVYNTTKDRVCAAIATSIGTIHLGYPTPSNSAYGQQYVPVLTGPAINPNIRIKAVCAEKNGVIAIAYATSTALRVIQARIHWQSTPQTFRTVKTFSSGVVGSFDIESDGTHFAMMYGGFSAEMGINTVGISCGAGGLKIGTGMFISGPAPAFIDSTPGIIRAVRMPDNSIVFVNTHKNYGDQYSYLYLPVVIAGGTYANMVAEWPDVVARFSTPSLGGVCLAAGGPGGYELLIGDTLSNRLVTANSAEYPDRSNGSYDGDRYPIGMAISDTHLVFAGSVVSGLTGLESGKVYYLDSYSRLSTEPIPTTKKGSKTYGRVGRAISSTELLWTRT